MKKKFFCSFLLCFLFVALFNSNIFAQDYRWPVQDTTYHVTSPYGSRVHPITGVVTMHKGVDLVANVKYILATKDATVIQTGTGYSGGMGNHIFLEHKDDKNHSIYMHLDKIYVKKGQNVKQGQIIGYMGTTGASTGVHLHFQLEKAPNYSLMNPNPTSRQYVYKNSHTHSYVYKTIFDKNTHPHRQVKTCICGKTKETDDEIYGLVTGCDKCKPIISTKSGKTSTATYKTIKWNKIKNANTYEYYLYQVDKKYAASYSTKSGEVSSNQVTLKNLLPGKYSFYVKAKNTSTSTVSSDSAVINFTVFPSKIVPESVASYDGKIYAAFNISTTWDYSREIMKSLGGDLAIIDSANKQNVITNILKKVSSKKTYYYIGGNDKAKQHTFKWINNKKLSYKNWAGSQPDDKFSDKPYRRHDYMSIQPKSNYRWNDIANLSNATRINEKPDTGFIGEVSLPPKPKTTSIIKVAQNGYGRAKITYNNVKSSYYRVYMAVSPSKKYILAGTSTTDSYIAKNLEIGKTYSFKIMPVTEKLGIPVLGTNSKVKSITIGPYRPSNFKVKKKSNKKVTVSYDASKEADYYEIYRKRGSGGKYKKIRTTKKLSIISKVKKNVWYYYKVRCYTTINSKKYYSGFTKQQKIRLK